MELNKIYQGDCLSVLKDINDNYIDLTVTSPPYDNLRTYNGFTFDFENIAKELYRVTKIGGVVVWVVGDATINGSETGTSFKQALYFKDIGFNLHDTMIYKKINYIPLTHKRYEQAFEYMFIFSKGKIKTFNPIKENTIYGGRAITRSNRYENHAVRGRKFKASVNSEKYRCNVWEYKIGTGCTTKDKIAFEHPAIFPEKLAEDHILSWSNKNDIILDPMCGSGTTCKMALKNNRNFIGIELSQEYCDIANKRIKEYTQQLKLA